MLESKLFGKTKVLIPQDEGWRVFLHSGFNLKKLGSMKEEKWVLANLEAIFVIWFVCLEIFLQKTNCLHLNKVLLTYAEKKLKQYSKSHNLEAKAQTLISLSFLIGFCEDLQAFENLKKIYKSLIKKKGLVGIISKKYVAGRNRRHEILKTEQNHKSTEQIEEKSELNLETAKIPNSVSFFF